MTLQTQVDNSLLLVLALFLSIAIGLDREGRRSPAGLRTHILVGLGACLFTILSRLVFPGSDPSRVAAQVVTGIGFIGAGTILRYKRDVQHLTTAASIWATAAVGMAVGTGAWFIAIVATLLVWSALAIIRRFEISKTKSKAESIKDG